MEGTVVAAGRLPEERYWETGAGENEVTASATATNEDEFEKDASYDEEEETKGKRTAAHRKDEEPSSDEQDSEEESSQEDSLDSESDESDFDSKKGKLKAASARAAALQAASKGKPGAGKQAKAPAKGKPAPAAKAAKPEGKGAAKERTPLKSKRQGNSREPFSADEDPSDADDRSPKARKDGPASGQAALATQVVTPSPALSSSPSLGDEKVDRSKTKPKMDLSSFYTEPAAAKSLDVNARAVFDLLRRVNRPFGHTELARLLKNLTKLQLTKALASLEEKGLATSVEQKIMWINQELFSAVPAKVKAEVAAHVQALEATIHSLRAKESDLKSQLARYQSQLSDAELTKQIAALGELDSKKKQQNKVENPALGGENNPKASNAGNKPNQAVLAKEVAKPVEQLIEEHRYFRKEWAKRKAAVEDVVKDLMETMPAKAKFAKVMEDLGMETDEICKVSIKNIDKL